ncbi:type II secretion system protein M [Pseudomonas sp. MMS21-TM103]|uniref:type II secretion system protein M n=1 Tax=Pseudomonas sp. MMS21 TM103 TaxID=2886506 RepID=UPI001EDF5A4B|nr:type II secretion system protein M [Pseudomonas sp. MMS21 TM103]MCG4453611.1 type II secretion system protein M [Pseudomonas sp. MMS21 TM103]
MGRLNEWMKPSAAQLQGSLVLQRWRALQARERLALGLLALFVLLALLYLMLWQPARQGVSAARSAFEQERALHAYLQAQAPLARSLMSKPQVSLDPARLQGLVTASAAEQGLVIERLDSDSDGSLQVSVQSAPFDQLLRWFSRLEQQGVRIVEAGLDRAEGNRVAARLTLSVAQ